MTENEERLLARALRLAGIIECCDCGKLTLSITGLCCECRPVASSAVAGTAR